MPPAHFHHFRETIVARDRIVLDALAARVAAVCSKRKFAPDSDAVAQLLQRALPKLPGSEIEALQSYVTNTQVGGGANPPISGGRGGVGAAAGGDGTAALLRATCAMQETQMAFNRQYLELQRQMAEENRSYTAVSNIMKTKHDTVKNSISNVR